MEGRAREEWRKHKIEGHVHIFGVKYLQNQAKSIFFNEQIQHQYIDKEERLDILTKQIEQLKQEISTIRDILLRLLYSDQLRKDHTLRSKKNIDLLQELMQYILEKAEENAKLKQDYAEVYTSLENCQLEMSQILMREMEENQSKKQSRLASSKHYQISNIPSINPSYEELEIDKVSNQNKSNALVQKSQKSKQSVNNKSNYRPQVLFSIGREVKTINQISNHHLQRKESSSNHGHSKSSSAEPFCKESSKKSRMSIDRTIYLTEDQNKERMNIYNIPNSYSLNLSQEMFSKESISKPDLAPIKEQRLSEMNNSNVTKGMMKLPKRERNTFQTCNTGQGSCSN